ARASLVARLPLAAEPELGARLDPRGDLDDQGLAAMVLALDVDLGLAATDGGDEGDGQVRLDVATRPGPRAPRPAPAAAHPAQQLLEDPARPGVLLGVAHPRAEELAEVERRLDAGSPLTCRPLRRPRPR